MIFEDAVKMIGNTPIVKLNRVAGEDMADIYIKLEGKNPGGSIKDRAALGMLEDAERKGVLREGSVIVEPTSGNTGIAIALIGRLKGYRVIITMPETMSVERRNIIKAYGAEVVLTEGSLGMKGAIDRAIEIAGEMEGVFIPQQFKNKANPGKHYETTAEEILRDIPDLDVFVAGVGTGGTITGVGRKLKEASSKIKIYAVEPLGSPVLSGGKPGKHRIQGIGAGFIPDVLVGDLIDKVVRMEDEEAFEGARMLASKEGLLLGISSGANIAAAIKVAREIGRGGKVLTVSPDGGEKYLSTGLFD